MNVLKWMLIIKINEIKIIYFVRLKIKLATLLGETALIYHATGDLGGRVSSAISEIATALL